MYEMFIATLHHVIEMHVLVVKVEARPTKLPGRLQRMLLKRDRMWLATLHLG